MTLRRQHDESRGEELTDFDHQSAKIDSEDVETLGETSHSPRTSRSGEPGQADAREEKFEEPHLEQVKRSEPQY